MVYLTEQQVVALAPNPAAAANGLKISQKGNFVRLMKSKDDTFYLGECTGSGKSNYMTSADFIEPENPVFRCTCPSRQFPCKHSLGLLFEILSGKAFCETEIPEEILKKRQKLQAKTEKTAAEPVEMTEEEKEKAERKAEKAKKAGAAARAKKAEKQLEGLDLVQKLLENLISAGLGTMGGSGLTQYQEAVKQLGDYYLPGPQKLLNRLILEIAAFREDQEESHYDAAIGIIEKLRALTKKSRDYLQKKTEQQDMPDNSMLYEELGGIWKLTELEEAGCGIENGRYAQLAFYVGYDEAAKEYTDYGIFMELGSGKIYVNKNIRPVKSMKYLKEEDSLFGVAQASRAAAYPGPGNQRIRWEGSVIRNYRAEDFKAIRSFAEESVLSAAKEAKNILKDPLAEPMYLMAVAFHRIGKTAAGERVLIDQSGAQLVLSDLNQEIASAGMLERIPETEVLEDQVMLAGFYENRKNRRIEAQPFSIITQDRVVRLF